MQDILELTRELGTALQLCPEYVRLVAAREATEADEPMQAQLRKLDLLRMQYQREMHKEDADETLLEGYQTQFDSLYSVITQTPSMAEYQEAAGELNALVQRITGILGGCANGEDPATYEPKAAGCGGDCGGCSGCG